MASENTVDTNSPLEARSIWTIRGAVTNTHTHNEGTPAGKKGITPSCKGDLLRRHDNLVRPAQLLAIARDFDEELATVFPLHIFDYYKPCALSVRELDKINFMDLMINSHNENKYIVVRTVTEAVSRGMFFTIIEDEKGDWEQLVLNCFDHLHSAADLLPKGCIMIIKQPFLRHAAESAFFIIVDHISDVMILPPTAEWVPEQWRPPQKAPGDWYSEGRMYLMEGMYRRSIHCFTATIDLCQAQPSESPQALTFWPGGKASDLIREALMCRCVAYNKIGASMLASKDAVDILKRGRLSRNAFLLAALANYYAREYDVALDYLKSGTEYGVLDGKDCFVRSLYKRASDRRSESFTGRANFQEMMDTILHNRTKVTECADYGRLIRNNGKALVFKTNVKSGQVIFVEKAAATCLYSESRMFSLHDHCLRGDGEVIPLASEPLILARRVAEKYINNPRVLSNCILTNGHGTPNMVDGRSVVNIFSFYFRLQPGNEAEEDIDELQTAFFNLCLLMKEDCWSNCFSRKIGDVLVCHAIRDINAGEELTVHPSNFNFLENVWGDKRCKCPFHNMEHLQHRELARKRDEKVLELSKKLSDGDIDEAKIKEWESDQNWLARSYEGSPDNKPQPARARACSLIASRLSSEKPSGPILQAQITFCIHGLHALGFTFTNPGNTVIKQYGILDVMALGLFDKLQTVYRILKDKDKEQAYCKILAHLWKIFFAVERAGNDEGKKGEGSEEDG